MLRVPYPQYILYSIVHTPEGDKKFPIDWKTGKVSDAHIPDIWMSYEDALSTQALFGGQFGIGFVLTEQDPLFFVDIDKCLLPDRSGWSPLALEILAMFPGAYVEVSQSGTGLHIIGVGTPSDRNHRNKDQQQKLEFYTHHRFIALTGNSEQGDPFTPQPRLDEFVAKYMPTKPYESTNVLSWTTEPSSEWNGPEDDKELIKRAAKAKSAAAVFGGGVTFQDLWERNVDALAKKYPPQSEGQDFDASSADAALAQSLAFWTGKNCERIYHLMNESALKRDKYQREDYIKGTILKAVAMQKSVYQATKPVAEYVPPPATVSHEPTVRAGYQYLGASQQIEHFKGCVYIQDIHRALTPTGAILKPEQFRATYGGYSFQLDDNGKTTKNAWEAFTESQVVHFPKADSSNFRPDLPSGGITMHEGRPVVNTYVPVNTDRAVGDVAPFTDHLAKLLPDERDQQILLSYMAACVQYKGTKFQWAPLIVGPEGNGKTLFSRVVAFAVGEKYTHFPPANEIAEKFNSWLFGKLFIGVEDIYVPDHRREVIEVLKPMISNERLGKRAMQQDQTTADNRANFILNSNHKDAIKKTDNDRRFAVFFCAQESFKDIMRDGMDGGYFPKLYFWLNNGGYAIVNEYLNTYPIADEFNPAKGIHRAPVTSSTHVAVIASQGPLEQAIAEAVEESRPGFAGGWISSVAVDRLLSSMNRSISSRVRGDLITSLGYIHHPALSKGRANNPINIDDNRKPVLYVKRDSVNEWISSGKEAELAYIAAQTVKP